MHADILTLVGILTPLLVAVVATARWSSQAKGIAAMLVSVVIGIATAYAGDLLTAANILGSVLAAYGAAQVAYTALFRPLGITSWMLDNLGRKDPGTGPVVTAPPQRPKSTQTRTAAKRSKAR